MSDFNKRRIESLQVLLTFDFGLLTFDLDFDCDKYWYLECIDEVSKSQQQHLWHSLSRSNIEHKSTVVINWFLMLKNILHFHQAWDDGEGGFAGFASKDTWACNYRESFNELPRFFHWCSNEHCGPRPQHHCNVTLTAFYLLNKIFNALNIEPTALKTNQAMQRCDLLK